VSCLLEASGFDTWLVNAEDVKHLPGRPKTGKLDCTWLCKVAERQMIRPGFVPPPEIRRLRDPTRYRADLAAARTAEKNRAGKRSTEDGSLTLNATFLKGCTQSVGDRSVTWVWAVPRPRAGRGR
jgi:transposase